MYNWRKLYVYGLFSVAAIVTFGFFLVGTFEKYGSTGVSIVFACVGAFSLLLYCVSTMDPKSNIVALAEDVDDQIGICKFVRHDNKTDERADMITIMKIMMDNPIESGMYNLNKDYMNRIIYLLGEEDE